MTRYTSFYMRSAFLLGLALLACGSADKESLSTINGAGGAAEDGSAELRPGGDKSQGGSGGSLAGSGGAGSNDGGAPGDGGDSAASGGQGSAAAQLGSPSDWLGPKLLQWWEAGRSETLVAGSTVGSQLVTSIADLSPHSWGYTGPATHQSLFEPAGWNGQPSYAFDGVKTFYTDDNAGAFADALATGNKPWTVWWVGQYFEAGSVRIAFSVGSAAADTSFVSFHNSSLGHFCVSRSAASVTKTVASATAFNTLRHVFELKNFGATLELDIDGAVAGVGDFDAPSATFYADVLGAVVRSSVGNYFKGRMVARIAMTGTPTSDEESAVNSYLTTKFMSPGTKPMLKIVGDSQSTPTHWQVEFAKAFPDATIVNTAVPGSTLYAYGLPNMMRDAVSDYDPARPASLVSMQYGTNDTALHGQSGASVYANLSTVVAAIRVNNPGEKILVSTIAPRQGLTASEENEANAFNSLVETDKAGADFLLKRGCIVSAPTNDKAWYADGIHLTAMGDAALDAGANGCTGIVDFARAAGF
jgi:hypothetical protein